MYYIVKREKLRRKKISKLEMKRLLLKSIWQNRLLKFSVRYLAFLELAKLTRESARVRSRNRCVLTGRSSSVLREFHLSRLKFREKAREGELCGIKQSSW